MQLASGDSYEGGFSRNCFSGERAPAASWALPCKSRKGSPMRAAALLLQMCITACIRAAGEGVYRRACGDVYRGAMAQGRFSGQGAMEYSSGDRRVFAHKPSL